MFRGWVAASSQRAQAATTPVTMSGRVKARPAVLQHRRLRLRSPKLSTVGRATPEIHNNHRLRADGSTKQAAVAIGKGVFSLFAVPTESLPAMFLLRNAEDVMDFSE